MSRLIVVATAVLPLLASSITAAQEVLNAREMRERMLAAGFEAAQTSVEEFDAFVRKDFRRYEKVVKESRIRVD